MESANKNILKFKFFFISLLFLCCISCSEEQSRCFYVVDLNYSVKTPFRGAILYGIQEEKVLERVIGENIVGDFYESNIKNLFIVMDRDTLDYFSKITLQKKSSRMVLRLPTGRYRWEFKDSIAAMNQIKKEHLVLVLHNDEIIRLNYCDD